MKKYISFSGGVESTTMCLLYGKGAKAIVCDTGDEEPEMYEQIDGTYVLRDLKAETSTGCTFCLFGLHLEDKNKNNRIQRLAISHPKYWHIVVIKCGLGLVMKYCGIPYKPMNEVGVQTELYK